MRAIRLATTLLLLAARPLAGQDNRLENLLDPALLATLEGGGEKSRTFFAGEVPTLLPAATPGGREILEETADLRPTIGVEVLRLYRGRRSAFDSPEGLLHLYNTLRSVSTMTGIQYYSASRKQMRTLFEEAAVVDSAEIRRRLPDPLEAEIPPYSRLLILQKDLTFGEHVYETEYFFSKGIITTRSRNLTPMWYWFLPMVGVKGIVTYTVLIPAGDRILYYGMTCARTLSLFGLERSREDSFYNRLHAIYDWLAGRLEAR